MGLFGKSKGDIIIEQIHQEVKEMVDNLNYMLRNLQYGFTLSNIEEVVLRGNNNMERHRKVQSLLNVLNPREQLRLRLKWIDNSTIPINQWDYSYNSAMQRIQNAVMKFGQENGFPF